MDRPVTKPDLLQLEAFLQREPIARTSMSLPMIDGMLTAAVIGPRAVMPSEFIQWIWDHEEGEAAPEFQDEDGARDILGIIMAMQNRPFFKESASHGVAKLGVQGTRRAERDLIGAQSFKEDSGLRNKLLIVEKPLDRDGGVENNPHALMRSVSKLAQVRERPWESAVLSPDLIAKGLDASEERLLGLGPGLSGESLDKILHPVLKWRW